MMPPAGMGELQFLQRWEFRRNEENDVDSSCDDSKSSSRSLLKKHKLVSGLITVGDDETSETSRLKQMDNENPGTGRGCQINNTGKAKKRRSRNNISSNLQNGERKRDSPEDVDLRKGETSAYVPADPLDDLKNFMDSLLKDLKVTRENLLKWMMEEVQKLVADDNNTNPPETKRRKRGLRGEKVQLQQTKNPKKVQGKHENAPKESMKFQHPTNSEKSIQVQHHTKFQETVIAQQQQSNFQENINLQHQNDFRYGMRTQNSNNRSLVGFPKGINAADSADYFNHALGDGAQPGQVTQLITSSSKNKEDILSKSGKPNLQTSCGDQSVQVQSQKCVVLAIEAQTNKAGSLKRSVKGKKTVDLIDNYQVLPEDQGGHMSQAMSTAVAVRTIGEKLGSSSAFQNFLSNPCGQDPSSMYLSFPPVLTEPIVANHRLDTSLFNYILPGDAEKKRGVNQMLEPSSFQGSFPVIPPDERFQSFALRGSRNMGCITQNSIPTLGTGTAAFHSPLHQGIDVGLSIPRQVNHQYLSQETGKPMGLRMNGGAIKFPGGSYNLSEHIAAANHHSHPAYQSDSRFMPYHQTPNIKDGHFFLQ